MAKENKILSALEKAYEIEKGKETESLHNAIVEIIHEQKTSVYNTLFVLDIIRFELMQAKYKEIMGVVKLGDKPPLKKSNKKNNGMDKSY